MSEVQPIKQTSLAQPIQIVGNKSSKASTDLAPLLRHFIGIDLIVESKHGRSFRGRLREADAYMNLVLSREPPEPIERKGNLEPCFGDSKSFDWVHIRGPSIRYIVFGSNVDIVATIRAGRDRERAAGDKYRRGVRKNPR